MRSFTSTSSQNRVRDLSANKRMTGSESSEAVRSPCCVPPTDPPFAMNDKMLVVNLNYAISAIKPAICLLRKYFLPKVLQDGFILGLHHLHTIRVPIWYNTVDLFSLFFLLAKWPQFGGGDANNLFKFLGSELGRVLLLLATVSGFVVQ